MERVGNNSTWSLFNPLDVPALTRSSGTDFANQYQLSEQNQDITKMIVNALDIWHAILNCQLETGEPLVDHGRDFLNGLYFISITCDLSLTLFTAQSNIEPITLPNLRAAAVNSSILLPSFVSDGRFDFGLLGSVVSKAVRGLNLIWDMMDLNVRQSGRRVQHTSRPIGIGVLGLADVYSMLKLPIDSEDARKLNVCIAEAVYYYALEASLDIARARGLFTGSQRFQYEFPLDAPQLAGFHWEMLRAQIRTHGLANIILTGVAHVDGIADIAGCGYGCDPRAK